MSVVRNLLNSVSETAAWVKTKFYTKLTIHHISRPYFFFFFFFFFFFRNFKFSYFHFFSLTLDAKGAKIAKRYSPHKWILKFLSFSAVSQTSPDFLSPISSHTKLIVWSFVNFEILNFNDFFFRFPYHGTMWRENYKKTLLLLMTPFKLLALISSQSYFFKFLKFCIF